MNKENKKWIIILSLLAVELVVFYLMFSYQQRFLNELLTI